MMIIMFFYLPKLAKSVLSKMKLKDEEQFKALLKSINVTIKEYEQEMQQN